MSHIKALPAVLVLLFLFAPLSADEVVLKNGQRIQGIVSESEKWVTVRIDGGSITLARSDVKNIIRKESPLQEYARRRPEVKNDDVKGLLNLARWARRKELYSKEKSLYKEIIRADPDHKTAREALGYRKHENKWMTEPDYWTALGYVKVNGKWTPRDVAIAKEKQAAESRRENQRLKTAERIKELEAEVEQARVEVERIRAENEWKYQKVYYYVPHYHTYGTVTCPCWCNKPRK